MSTCTLCHEAAPEKGQDKCARCAGLWRLVDENWSLVFRIIWHLSRRKK